MGKQIQAMMSLNTMNCDDIIKIREPVIPRIVLVDTSETVATSVADTRLGGIITIHNLSDYRIKNTSNFLLPDVACLLEKLIKSRRDLDCIPIL